MRQDANKQQNRNSCLCKQSEQIKTEKDEIYQKKIGLKHFNKVRDNFKQNNDGKHFYNKIGKRQVLIYKNARWFVSAKTMLAAALQIL